MRRDDQRQAVKNIPLEQLKPFKNHPFQVRDDEEFRRLVESIEIHGVIHPAVARQIGEECYELISGHRRKAACEVLGYKRRFFPFSVPHRPLRRSTNHHTVPASQNSFPQFGQSFTAQTG